MARRPVEHDLLVTLVWLPFAGPDEVRRRLGDLPAGVEVDFYGAAGDEVPGSIAEVELYVLPYMRPDALPLMAHMHRLKVVQTLTAGVDDVAPHVPVGVTLCNAAGVHDASTAELAVALMLASGRHLDVFARQQAQGLWRSVPGTSLADRRVLIFGYGRIGQAIEARLAGFEVASITRVARRAREEPTVHGSDELLELLAETDVLVIIAPLTAETEGVINAAALSRLPDGAQVINVARGRLVDTAALLAETSTGRLSAALDVTDPEPLPADHPLWRVPNVLISPHVGGASSAFLPRADRLIAAQLRRYAAGQPLLNQVAPAGSS